MQRLKSLPCLVFLFWLAPSLGAESTPPTTQLSELVSAARAKVQSLESAASRRDYQAFLASRHLEESEVRYSDYAMVHLLFEATRDAGYWGLHWSVTDQPPNSDRIWQQWKSATSPSFTRQSATAECDELSALFSFLVARAGVKSVGLFWPYTNHTVAVWTIHTARASNGQTKPIRVVIPTSQVFLTDLDTFDTRRFDPWRQKTIYDYTRRDVPDSFALPGPLFDFFLSQLDKYAGASESTLQQLRNLRDAVFNGNLSPEQAARAALGLGSDRPAPAAREDLAAFEQFAWDLGHLRR